MQSSDARVGDLLARQQIMACVHAYVRGQDRLDGPLQRSAFWDDAWVDHGYFAGFADDFVAFAQGVLTRHESNHHMLGQVDIEIVGNQAYGEVYTTAHHRIFDETGAALDHFVAGRYIDRYERRGDTWKIVYRSELVDWARTLPAADSFFLRRPEAHRGTRGFADLSYRRTDLHAPAGATRPAG